MREACGSVGGVLRTAGVFAALMIRRVCRFAVSARMRVAFPPGAAAVRGVSRPHAGRVSRWRRAYTYTDLACRAPLAALTAVSDRQTQRRVVMADAPKPKSKRCELPNCKLALWHAPAPGAGAERSGGGCASKPIDPPSPQHLAQAVGGGLTPPPALGT